MIALTISLALVACSPSTPTKELVAISLKKIMPPNFEVVSVKSLQEIPGLNEVSVKMGSQIVVLYVDNKAQYAFSGSLVQVDTKKNLTIEAQEKLKIK